jgi:hypothetical protein
MFKFKQSVLGVATACVLASTSAHAAFSSFWFDADGANPGNAVLVNEFFDINTRFLAQNTYDTTPGTTYTFNQYGTANITGIDSLGYSGNATSMAAQAAVGVKFAGNGIGDLAGQTVTFQGGTIRFYNPAFSTLFAEFSIIGDSGATSSGIPNGFSTLVGRSSFIDAGYFFKDIGGVMGADLMCSGQACIDASIYNFATTNVSLVTNQNSLNGIDGLLSAAFTDAAVQNANGVNLFDTSGRPTQFYASSNGQDRLQIPEPGSLALFGLGLVGLVVARRRPFVK